MKKVYHLTITATGEHRYYGSLVAVFVDNKLLRLSRFNISRHSFATPYKNNVCTIRLGWIVTSGDARRNAIGLLGDNRHDEENEAPV